MKSEPSLQTRRFTEQNHKWPIIIWGKSSASQIIKKLHIKTIRVTEFIDELVKMKNNKKTKSYLGMGNQAFPHNASKCVN